ncbi:3-phosphoserine/phosphohydroxythreonine transaminase [Salisediminibacterium halotolerans]|uniref:Phosphoserine aminotransferase n=1 Tax=Salisediminibacterium halotolerans TaxID=517425 RepID=A0A1H9TG52_9BACI|nr:3-phosphoserine/phosphohydroxythreonine transaminase [Salisediminibacterium haloalkalitolerans]SER96320.1 phosphoserine aminotransferase apoenzyme [Salisediminibacterium haloalkalitolerans]
MTQTYNFNPGPGPIPNEVLAKAQQNMFNFEQTGMAVMELSHRSAAYERVHFHAMNTLRELLDIPDDFSVLFLQGGASLQFSMLAKNFLSDNKAGAYVLSGSWAEKAQKEGAAIGEVYTAAASSNRTYADVPVFDPADLQENTAYVHLTSNNTIYGTQLSDWPACEQPVFVDMSSDILSRPIPWDRVDLAYAGAQKNAGMAGVTIAIIRTSLLDQASGSLPPSLSYKQHADKDSLYNTPPTGAIYITSLVLDWIKEQGGITEMENRAKEKAALIYDVIDRSNGFYSGHADKDSRSWMNITFRLPSEELEKKFLNQASERGFTGLNGHRSVGGCRVSNYNAVPREHVEILRDFMLEFQQNHS